MAQPSTFLSISRPCVHSVPMMTISHSILASFSFDLAWFSFGWISLTWSFDFSNFPLRGFVFGHHIDFFFFSFVLFSLSLILFSRITSHSSHLPLIQLSLVLSLFCRPSFCRGTHLPCSVLMHDLTVCIQFPLSLGAPVTALCGVSLLRRMQIATEIAYNKTWGWAIATQQGNFNRQTLAADKTRYWVEIIAGATWNRQLFNQDAEIPRLQSHDID